MTISARNQINRAFEREEREQQLAEQAEREQEREIEAENDLSTSTGRLDYILAAERNSKDAQRFRNFWLGATVAVMSREQFLKAVKIVKEAEKE